MGTPPGRPQLISSQTLGAHVPRRPVALLDTIARADHISRGQVVRRPLVREVEQHKRRSRRDRPRRPATCATFDAELETQLVAIVANMKPGRRQLIGGQTLGAPTVQASRGETGGGLVCIPWLHLCVVRLTGERNLGVPFCRPQSPEEDLGV